MNRKWVYRSIALSLPAALLAVSSYAADSESRRVTFTRDVAPVFMDNCVVCHRPGEVAPMSLLTYEEARPWAKSIRKAIAAKAMPPWRVDPNHGSFKNDMRLTDDEVATILRWVDTGAPQGNPADMPPAPTFSKGWQLGEPDYIIELPPTEVPEAGDDLFPDRIVKIELPESKWARAIEFLPGEKSVVHHVLAVLGEFGMDAGEGRQHGGGAPEIFSVWVAGSQPTVYPDGTGRVIRKRQTMTFNMHYHPNGKATTDRTLVGLYFGEGELQKRITTTFAVNTGFHIPPGDDNFKVNAFYLFDHDSKIISFLPHMHVRGKDMEYTAVYPDGRKEILLKVPAYDYNWQWIYYPTEHISVPAGTRIEVEAHYDNSAGNLNNPDPSKDVYYRSNTLQEMFVGFMEFIVDEGVAPKPSSPSKKLDILLADHPADMSYKNGGLMGLPWGLYLPEEGEGIWYLVLGNVMFSSTVREITWDGDAFSFESGMVTAGGGGISMSVNGTVNDIGEMAGEIRLGTLEAAERPEENKIMTLPFTGQRVSAQRVASAR